MLFSGSVTLYRCDACNSEFSDATPTSLIPLGVTIAISAPTWMHVFKGFGAPKFVAIAGGLVAAVVAYAVVFTVVDRLTRRKLRRHECTTCGGKLKQTGIGFYDTLVPNLWELVIYGIAIALPWFLK